VFCEVRIVFSGAALTGCVLSSLHLRPTLDSIVDIVSITGIN